MKHRLSLVLVALLAVTGAAVVPAATADAAGGTTTGTIKVQLQKPSGDNFYKKGFVVTAGVITGDVCTVAKAKTNSQGVAALHIAPGKYTISVVPYCNDYRYAVNSKKLIAISRGQVKTIGLKMYVGAQVTGKVMTPTGFALAGAKVAAVTSKGLLVGVTTSDKHGKYRLAGLPTDKVKIIFNYRTYDNGKDKTVANYSSAYYKGGKKIQVYQQNRFANATKTTGISGPVTKGTTLNVTLSNVVNSKTSTMKVDRISAKGAYLPVGSIYAPFAGGTSAQIRVAAGTFRLGIQVAGVNYYYAGYGVSPTTSIAGSQLTYFDGVTPVYVQFGPLP